MCFIAAFALVFITVKPVAVKAVGYSRTDMNIQFNPDGLSISATDANGSVTTPADGGTWELRVLNPNSSGYCAIKNVGFVSLNDVKWAEVMVSEGTTPVVGTTYRGYLREYIPDGESSVACDYGFSVTYTGTAPATYTVKFDSNGGSAVADQTLNVGERPAKPTSTRDGYDLAGWYLVNEVFNEGPSGDFSELFGDDNYLFGS